MTSRSMGIATALAAPGKVRRPGGVVHGPVRGYCQPGFPSGAVGDAAGKSGRCGAVELGGADNADTFRQPGFNPTGLWSFDH